MSIVLLTMVHTKGDLGGRDTQNSGSSLKQSQDGPYIREKSCIPKMSGMCTFYTFKIVCQLFYWLLNDLSIFFST